MVLALSALEIWIAPDLDLFGMGSTRVGVECVPKH